jgi:hypothetical protein
MLYKFVLCVLVLVVSSSLVCAVDVSSSTEAMNIQMAESNRFLAAEVSKQIRAANDETVKALKEYQDENFMMLDERMSATMHEVQQRLIVGAAGAILLGGALIGFFMFHLARKYSYERYLEDELERRDVLPPQGYQQPTEAMQQVQQPTWQQQQPFQSVAMDMGQSVSNMSQFNNWQVQPARQGGWEYTPEEWRGQQ